MNLITAGLTSAILAAGSAGAVSAYRTAAGPAEAVVPVKQQTVEPAPIVSWAPCQPPSRLENDKCVTDVVRTVIRPAPPAARPETPDYSDDYEAPEQVAAVRDDVDDDLYGEDRDDDGEDRDDDGEDRDEDQDEERGFLGYDSDDDDGFGWGFGDDDERDDDD